MDINLPYFLHVAIAISVFYMAFFLLFSKEKMFAFNRYYLVTSMLVSFIIPLITFYEHILVPEAQIMTQPDLSFASELQATSALQVASASQIISNSSASQIVSGQAFHNFSWQQLMGLLFISGFIFFLTILIIGHIKVLMIVRKSSKQSLYGHSVWITQKDIPPFTYFGKLIIPSNIINNPHIQSVVHHEYIHKKEMHCIDLLLMEILFVFQWFNPFAWFMRKAVRDNLEFRTDDIVTNFIDKQEYQLGIISLAGKTSFYTFPSISNQSQLKNRIIMMAKHKPTKSQWIRTLTIIPMLTILTITLSGREVKFVYTETEENTNIIKSENAHDITKDEINQSEESIEVIEQVFDSKSQTSDNRDISGKVTDEKGKPIAGVYVTMKGISTEVSTDSDGNFKLTNIPNDAVLLFMAPNYDIKDVAVNNQKNINVRLKQSSIFTGSLIASTKIGDSVLSIYDNYMAMKYPTKMYPGDEFYYDIHYMPFNRKDATIYNLNDSTQKKPNIANILNLNKNAKPLYILDDKRYTSSEFNLSLLDNKDIQSVTIMKDDKAVKLYGNDAKGGVIIITTKKDPNNQQS